MKKLERPIWAIEEKMNEFESMNLQEAIELLKNAVKESHLDNQPHIDLTLVLAPERPKYEYALMVTRTAVARGEMSEAELKEQLGLN